MNEELAKVVEALAIEQQTREDSEASLVQVLEDMCGKMNVEVQVERNGREVLSPVLSVIQRGLFTSCLQGTEEVFLKLLEETCDRVQTGLRP